MRPLVLDYTYRAHTQDRVILRRFQSRSPQSLLPRRRHCDADVEHDTKLSRPSPLKTIGRRLPQYVAMSPPPSDDSAAAPPSLPMSSGGGVTAFLSVVVSSSDMVSRAGGSSRLNYELGSSRTSWQRVKEMESLGYFPTGYDRAAGTETLLRPDGEVLVLLTCLVLEFLP